MNTWGRYGIATILTTALLASCLYFAGRVMHAKFDYHSKPEIQLVAPPAPACKVCRCHKTSCHRECGENNMCVMKCEGLCQKEK